MNGADNFVSHNFSEYSSTFNSCLNLIIYSYLSLHKNKTYSRREILTATNSIRRKKTKKIELEDFLRNDLVVQYIEPNKKLFGLDYYLFQSGAEEFSNNIKVGILDIKVCSPLLNGNTYFVFECKRLNKGLIDKYVKEGISRFIKEQYYPNSGNYIAGMIAFLESITIEEKINCSDSYKEIDTILYKYKSEIKLNGSLAKYKLSCDEFNYIENYDYVFVSSHNRIQNPIAIELYHIILDYNDLIIE